MFGLAYHEATRSQKYALRFQQQQQASAQPSNQGIIAGAICDATFGPQHVFPSEAEVAISQIKSGSEDVADTSVVKHKRTRRRRRVKKPHPENVTIVGYEQGDSLKRHQEKQSHVGMLARWTNKSSKQERTAAFATNAFQKTSGGSSAVAKPTLPTITTTAKPTHDLPMKKRDMYFSLRCGMVKTGVSFDQQAVGRVTLVNWDNQVVLDNIVHVMVPIIDYQVTVSGLTKERVNYAMSKHTIVSLEQARATVRAMINGKILIGHGLELELSYLGLQHPQSDVRDTATYPPFMQEVTNGSTITLIPHDLSTLVQMFLRDPVYNSGPPRLPCGPIEEAQANLALYKHARLVWENDLMKLIHQKERNRNIIMNMRQRELQRKEHVSNYQTVCRSTQETQSLSSECIENSSFINNPFSKALTRSNFQRIQEQQDDTYGTNPTFISNGLFQKPSHATDSFVTFSTSRFDKSENNDYHHEMLTAIPSTPISSAQNSLEVSSIEHVQDLSFVKGNHHDESCLNSSDSLPPPGFARPLKATTIQQLPASVHSSKVTEEHFTNMMTASGFTKATLNERSYGKSPLSTAVSLVRHSNTTSALTMKHPSQYLDVTVDAGNLVASPQPNVAKQNVFDPEECFSLDALHFAAPKLEPNQAVNPQDAWMDHNGSNEGRGTSNYGRNSAVLSANDDMWRLHPSTATTRTRFGDSPSHLAMTAKQSNCAEKHLLKQQACIDSIDERASFSSCWDDEEALLPSHLLND